MSYTTAVAAGANFALPYLASLVRIKWLVALHLLITSNTRDCVLPFVTSPFSQGKVDVWVPLVIIGFVCIISGICSSFLPETLYKNLPQTIKDGDEFNKDFKFFSLASKEPEDVKKNLSDENANLTKPLREPINGTRIDWFISFLFKVKCLFSSSLSLSLSLSLGSMTFISLYNQVLQFKANKI